MSRDETMGEMIGQAHYCHTPENPTEAMWQQGAVWRCDHCLRWWIVTLGTKWHGFLGLRLAHYYEWSPYLGPVEQWTKTPTLGLGCDE